VSVIIEDLCKLLEIDADALAVLAEAAPRMYSRFKIPKKNGGMRSIEQPAEIIKKVQYFLIDVLEELPVHPSATAYVKGKGIKNNAQLHKNNRFLLKLDFTDFFHSIRPIDFRRHIRSKLGSKFNRQELAIIWRFLFFSKDFPEGDSRLRPGHVKELCLSIGAPSSPFISNTMLFDFDDAVYSICEEENVIYSRYSDDLTFSTNQAKTLSRVERKVRRVIQENGYSYLEINPSKTISLSKKYSRRITGLVITNDSAVSIGRKRKRQLKSTIFSYQNGLLSDQEMSQLAGWLSFVKDVEPSFLVALKKKYGKSVIDSIWRSKASSVPSVKPFEGQKKIPPTKIIEPLIEYICKFCGTANVSDDSFFRVCTHCKSGSFR